MLLSAWLFIGGVAVLATCGAVLTTDDGLAILTGIAGFVSWAMWTYGTLNVEVVGDAVVYQFAMPSVTLLGVGLALIPGYVALTGPIEVMSRVQDTRMEEV